MLIRILFQLECQWVLNYSLKMLKDLLNNFIRTQEFPCEIPNKSNFNHTTFPTHLFTVKMKAN